MQSYKDFLAEARTSKRVNPHVSRATNAKEFGDEIQSVFFGNLAFGQIKIHVDSSLGSTSLDVRFTMAQKFASGIDRNDPAYHILSVDGFAKDGSIAGPLTVELLSGGIRTSGKTLKVFRKLSGDPTKVLAGLDAFFGKVRSTIKDNSEEVQKVVGTLYDVTDYV